MDAAIASGLMQAAARKEEPQSPQAVAANAEATAGLTLVESSATEIIAKKS